VTVPVELRRSVPRHVTLTPWGRVVVVLMALLFASAAAALLWPFVQTIRVPLWLPPVLAAGLAASGAALFVAIRRQVALLTSGRATTGRVTKVRTVRHQHGPSHQITVEFERLDGAARSACFRKDKAPAVGTEVVVLYDPDDATRRAIHPLRLARARDNH
jgi:hypothetical protein